MTLVLRAALIASALPAAAPARAGTFLFHAPSDTDVGDRLTLRTTDSTGGMFNPLRSGDPSYTDTDAFISGTTVAGTWNRMLAASGLAGLTRTFINDGINSDSANYVDPAARTFAAGASAAENLWIGGGTYNGPDGLNAACKLARIGGSTVTVAAPVPVVPVPISPCPRPGR